MDETKRRSLRVLMLGWEFAPFLSGGLGRACERIVRELVPLGMKVDFVVPKFTEGHVDSSFRIIDLSKSFSEEAGTSSLVHSFPTSSLRVAQINGKLAAYHKSDKNNPYAGDLHLEVERYAERVLSVIKTDDYDIIHAHDWMTFPAALQLSRVLRIPWIAHFHSLESDRNPTFPSPVIEFIERTALENADHVITVSRYAANCLKDSYNSDTANLNSKLNVIYNGTDTFNSHGKTPARISAEGSGRISKRSPKILFMGRLTIQKGVQYLGHIAAEVLKQIPDAQFTIGGHGEMREELMKNFEDRGIGQRIQFLGKLDGEEVSSAYHSADIFIMPSVSEPFGLVAAEAIEHGVPVVLSDRSGASEVMPSAFTSAPDDTHRFAGLINLVLSNPEIGIDMVRRSRAEMRRHTWQNTARQISSLYNHARH